MPARSIYLIKRLEVASRALLEVELRDLDLTPSQYTTLSMLAPQAECSSAELAKRVLVTPQSMSEMITALQRKELIKRRESEANRRILRISLSPAGRALLEKAETRVDGIEAKLFAALTAEEHAAFRAALEAVLADGRTQRSASGD